MENQAVESMQGQLELFEMADEELFEEITDEEPSMEEGRPSMTSPEWISTTTS